LTEIRNLASRKTESETASKVSSNSFAPIDPEALVRSARLSPEAETAKTNRLNMTHTVGMILVCVGFVFLIALMMYEIHRSGTIDCNNKDNVTACVLEHVEVASTLKWIETILSTFIGGLSTYLFANWNNNREE
jgi:hypothetical protein